MQFTRKRFDTWAGQLSSIDNSNFEEVCLEVFQYQAIHNKVYSDFLSHLKVNPTDITTLAHIPFLPIELFKTHQVLVAGQIAETVFESSGTTGQEVSKHYVSDLKLYENSFTQCFLDRFGPPADYCILGLLPSYLERGSSSLVYMVNRLIQQSGHPSGGFYLNNLEALVNTLTQLEANGQKYILFGVTYALLDLAEAYPMHLNHATIIETGGMKGQRKEITRETLHKVLKQAFTLDKIYSEYGMTELLSQAYTLGENRFYPPNWLRVLARDPYDPLQILPAGHSGALNVIDLANIHSCAFIATSDLTRTYADGSFEVLGRLDNTTLRGCNLMVQ